jgi:hypothetical protein
MNVKHGKPNYGGSNTLIIYKGLSRGRTWGERKSQQLWEKKGKRGRQEREEREIKRRTEGEWKIRRDK